MNIAFDLTWMSLNNYYGGVHQYALRVVTAVINYSEENVIIICSDENKSIFDQFAGNKRVSHVIKPQFSSLYEIVEKEKIDVIHTPIQHHLNFSLSVPMITTLHDLQPFYFPEFFTSEEIAARNLHYRKSAEFSERVIVSYQHVKDDLVKFYDIPYEKIDVCGHGMAAAAQVTSEQINTIRRKYSLPESYLFYSANTWRHKNHIGLLRGLKLLHEKHGFTISLICTGLQYPDFFPQIEEEIKRLGLISKVRFLGYLPEEEIPAVLCGATLAVVPTLYEAGSYPLMEAMNNGVPVICSSTTSLPDTIGDLRFVFDPNSPEEMAEKMAMMLTDERMREVNVANSAVRVIEWRWEKTVHSFLECYKKAIDGFAIKKNRWFSDWAANYEFYENQQNQRLSDEMWQLRDYINKLEKELYAMKHSLSWRLTKPLRWLGSRIKEL